MEIHPDDAKARGIESGDQVMMHSDRFAGHMATIHGVHGNDFQFSQLMKNGHIELSKAAVTAVAIVSPVVKKGMLYANMLDMRRPSNSLAARVVDQIGGNYKMGVARVKKIGDSQCKKEFRSFSWTPRNIV